MINKKRNLFAATIGFGLAVAPLRAELIVQPQDVIAVCTETRPQPKMASVDIADYLLMCQPVQGVRVVQAGGHRESLEGFMRRLENDLPPFRPTVVLTSYGIGMGQSDAASRGQTYYEPTYLGQTIAALKKTGIRTIIIGSSGCVDSLYFRDNPAAAATWNQNLAALRDVDRRVAEKAGVLFADIYSPMVDAMPKAKAVYGEKYHFGATDNWDQYPAANGQLIMASAFLKALGCDGAIGTITVDLAANKAEATPGHRIVSVQNGLVEVESTRYPFCFQGNPDRPESTSGVIGVFPFNDDLNRFLLVIKGFTGAKAKVTWGSQSREFSAADLAKGVNLAAAFAAHTPFDAAFAKVESAVWAQQEPEALFLQSFFHNIADYRSMAPGQTAAIDQVAAAIVERDRSRTAAAAALVIPVRHTVKIEVVP